MAVSLARLGCRVLYVEMESPPPGSPAPGSGQLAEEAGGGIHVVTFERTPLLPVTFPGPNLRLNMARNRRRLEAAVERLGLTDFAMLHYGWYSADLAGSLGQKVDVVECIDAHEERDHIRALPGMRDYVWRTERTLLRRANGLVVTSPVLLERRAAETAHHVVMLNGVDPDAFPQDAPEPPELRGVSRPRIALAGVLGRKIDFDLVEAAASAVPDVQIVVLGPVVGGQRRAHQGTAVHYFGAMPHTRLAACLTHCDLGIIPLVESDFNRASCPLKALEYLAAGLPVASVANPAVAILANRHPGVIRVAETRNEWRETIRQVVALSVRAETRTACRAAATEHTWLKRAQSLLDFLAGVPADRRIPSGG